MKNMETSNPLDHVKNIQSEFEKLIDHLRKDISIVKEPRAKALFETSAEVLRGLAKAFSDYCEKNEKAWKNN